MNGRFPADPRGDVPSVVWELCTSGSVGLPGQSTGATRSRSRRSGPLHLMSVIVELHGGTIEAESNGDEQRKKAKTGSFAVAAMDCRIDVTVPIWTARSGARCAADCRRGGPPS